MIPPDLWDDELLAVAAFLTAIGTLIAAVVRSAIDARDARERHNDNTAKLDQAVAELSPNHGSSLKDAIARIERRQRESDAATAARLVTVTDLLHQLGARLDAQRDDINDLQQRKEQP